MFGVGTTGGSGGNGGSLTIGRSTSVRGWGLRQDGWDPSDVSRVSYFISRGPATTPNVSGSSFGGGHYARVSSTQPASMFRYTLDGSAPTLRSPVYRGPVRVAAGGQFRARSFAYDHAPSASVSWNAPFDGILSPAEAPTFDPPAGAYPSGRAVTLSSTTSGATIHYTTDGSAPTTSSPLSVPSGGTVLVTRGLALRAIAAASGFDASGEARADYRITGKLVGASAPDVNAHSALLLKADGTVWGWGSNAGGQLGPASATPQVAPVQVTGLSGIKDVALGRFHGLAVTSTGAVLAWGEDASGQLGDGGIRTAPDAGSGARSHRDRGGRGHVHHLVRAERDRDRLLLGQQRLRHARQRRKRGWGRPMPAPIALADVMTLAPGNQHVLALTRGGTVWGWGSNSSGQLGTEPLDYRHAPLVVSYLEGITAIAAGGGNSIALKSDGDEAGQVWAWGQNGGGSLGDGSGASQSTPVHVLDDARVVAIGQGWAYYLLKGTGGNAELLGAGTTSASTRIPGAHPTARCPRR